MRRRAKFRLPQRCVGCGRLVDKWVLHHVVPITTGGQDIPSNLVVLCLPCHRASHRRPDSKSLDIAEYISEITEDEAQRKLFDIKTADDFIQAACQLHNVPVEAVRGSARNRRLVEVRAQIAHHLRSKHDMTLIEIGALLGGRDHSTIIHYLDTRNPDGSKKA